MEYRGKFYLVFQNPTPNRWTWSVDLDPHTIESGQAATKTAAIRAAERRIDKSLKPAKQKLAGVVIRLFPGRVP